MDWIGTPVCGGCEPTAGDTGSDVVGTGNGGVGRISEMTGPDAGSAGMPPYPGMPYCRRSGSEYGSNGGPDGPGRLSMAATRKDSSPIWRCMPSNMAPICCCACTRAANDSSMVGGAGGGAGVPEVVTGADETTGSVVAPEEATGDVAEPVEGTTEEEKVPEEAMISDTKLLALRLLRLYWWLTGGRGLKRRRRTRGAVAGVELSRVDGKENNVQENRLGAQGRRESQS